MPVSVSGVKVPAMFPAAGNVEAAAGVALVVVVEEWMPP